AGLIEKVRAHADQTVLAKRLATIRCDVEVAEALDDFRYGGPDREALEAICRELEFHRLLREIPLLSQRTAVEVAAAPVVLEGREGDEVLGELPAAAACALALTTSVAS